jgi:prepilin-type N-terminal cleavage/methylation domain-containing protein
MRRQSGFTLMELMIIIAIIGVLIGIAVPNFLGWLPKYRLRSAADELFTNLNLAKMAAVRRGEECTVSFTAQGYGIDLLGKSIKLADYGSGVTFEKSDGSAGFPSSPMVFGSRGLLNPPSRIIYLTNSQKTDFYKVRALTSGLIKIEK